MHNRNFNLCLVQEGTMGRRGMEGNGIGEEKRKGLCPSSRNPLKYSLILLVSFV